MPDGTSKQGSVGQSAISLARSNADNHPVSDYHSLLVLSASKRLYQVEVDPRTGDYPNAVREIERDGDGYRKVLNISGEGEGEGEGDAAAGKVAVALLPIKDEPNSAHICCYLANVGRLSLNAPPIAWDTAAKPNRRDATLWVAEADLERVPYDQQGVLREVTLDANTRHLEGHDYEQARELLAQGCLAGEVESRGELVPLINLAGWRHAQKGAETPNVATVNPDGKVYVAETVGASQGQGSLPARVTTGALLALLERSEASNPPLDGEDRLERRNRSQFSNIAVAILPPGATELTDGSAPRDTPTVVFNALRLNVKNAWTVAEWSDQQQSQPQTSEPPPNAPFAADLPIRTSRRLFIATAPGTVCEVDLAACSRIDRKSLKRNSDVWRLLRNGCLAGTVTTDRGPRELVNLASFGGTLSRRTDLLPKSVLASTWDFKWRAGKTLRVAFAPLRPPTSYAAGVVQELKQKVEQLARSWVDDPQVNLKLAPFVEFDGATPYDILIDLNDLPLEIAGNKSRAAREVTLPFSEVGSYASRLNRGEPTLYLGFPEGIKGEDGKPAQRTQRLGSGGLDGYFGSSAFEHVVLHEFGHALGLPHLHQSPDLTDPFVDAAQAAKLLGSKLGVAMSEAEVLEELKLRWSGPGAGDGTDWLDLIESYAAHRGESGADVTKLRERLREGQASGALGPFEQGLVGWLADNSVMMGLPARHVYEGLGQRQCVRYFRTLGTIDRAWIRQLYPL